MRLALTCSLDLFADISLLPRAWLAFSLMNLLKNSFKSALLERRTQIGLWLVLANSYTTEICAGAGFDWLLLDGEHSPNTLTTLVEQLQAAAAYPVAPVVRVPWNDSVRIKQVLDLGVQNLLVPMVQNAAEAETAVAATRYPPQGIRGIGSAGARASRWNRIPDYLHKANDEICVLVQLETPQALANLESIAAVPGVDGVFIGPADLSATMGHIGNPGHPEVQAAIDDGIARILAAGKAPGILHSNTEMCQRWIEQGAVFVAVGLDGALLARATEGLAAKFKDVTVNQSQGPY